MATILLLKTKLKEFEEWWLAQWQIKNTDHTLQNSFWQRICTPQNVSQSQSLWLTSNLFLQTAHDVNETLSFTRLFSSTIACLDVLQYSPHALLSFLDADIRIGDKLQIRDNAALGTPSSIASSGSSLATLPPKGDLLPTSLSEILFFGNNERRGN